jgi:hypothetical protein
VKSTCKMRGGGWAWAWEGMGTLFHTIPPPTAATVVLQKSGLLGRRTGGCGECGKRKFEGVRDGEGEVNSPCEIRERGSVSTGRICFILCIRFSHCGYRGTIRERFRGGKDKRMWGLGWVKNVKGCGNGEGEGEVSLTCKMVGGGVGKVGDVNYVSHSSPSHCLYRCTIKERFSGERDLSFFLFFSYHERFCLRLWGY